jgi:hypothetical protein
MPPTAAVGSGDQDAIGHGGLAEEAIFLGLVVVGLLPNAREAKVLLSLMLHCEARRAPNGAYIPLARQDPRLWDAVMIREAEALLVAGSRAGVFGLFLRSERRLSNRQRETRTFQERVGRTGRTGANGLRRVRPGADPRLRASLAAQRSIKPYSAQTQCAQPWRALYADELIYGAAVISLA